MKKCKLSRRKIEKIRDTYCRILSIFRLEKPGYHHTFVEGNEEEVIIVASDTGFKAYKLGTKDIEVKPYEILYSNAKLMISKCMYCGKKVYNWSPNYYYDEDLMNKLYPKEE